MQLHAVSTLSRAYPDRAVRTATGRPGGAIGAEGPGARPADSPLWAIGDHRGVPRARARVSRAPHTDRTAGVAAVPMAAIKPRNPSTCGYELSVMNRFGQQPGVAEL